MRNLMRHLEEFAKRKRDIFSDVELTKWKKDIGLWEDILKENNMSVADFLVFKWKENELEENRDRVLPVSLVLKKYLASKISKEREKTIYNFEFGYMIHLGVLFECDEFGEFKDAPILIGEIYRSGNQKKLSVSKKCYFSCSFCSNKTNCRFLEYCNENNLNARILPHFFRDRFEVYAPNLLEVT